MPHNGPLQVSIGIVLARLVVSIVETRRRQLLEPDLEVVNEPLFPVVDVNARGDVHGRHQHHAVRHAALVDNVGNFVGDANELLTGFGVEPQVIGVCHKLATGN